MKPVSVRTGARTAAILMASSLILAACGSTIPKSRFAQGAGGSGLSANGSDGLALPSGQGGPTGGIGGAGGTGTGLPSGNGGLGGSGVGSGSDLRIAAPGITDDAIYLGGYYTKNQGSGNAALGAGGLDQGDARDPFNVVINDVNARGGILGRKVVPIYYGWNATSAVGSDQQDQAACAKYTQDNKVFVIVVSGAILDECAKKAGILELGYGGAVPETYTRYPHRIDVGSMNMVRMGFVTVDGLHKQGYFDKGSRIGMVTWDDPNYREAISKGYVEALKRDGLKLATSTAYLAVPQTPQDLAQASADVSAAVLRFKTQRIDHVMVLDGPAGLCGGACITIEWLQQANSQRYYPRHGFNDTNSAKELDELGLMPEKEAQRSISIGWTDLDESYETGWHPNPQRVRCVKLMKEHGIDTTDPNAMAAALDACDDLWFLELVLGRVRGTLTVDGVIEIINQLRYEYLSTLNYANYFSATRHDGIAGVRTMHWVDSCGCFKFADNAPYRV